MELIKEGTAHAAEQGNAEAVEVNSIKEVIDLLERLKRDKIQLAYLDFHTHGNSGRITLGEEYLTANVLEKRFKRFDEIFRADARVEFHGCIVANGAEGEYFLATCGKVLLGQSGGAVAGHTGYAFAFGHYGFDATTPAYLGSEVVARVGAGGTVALEGATHLRQHRLLQRLRSLQAQYRAYKKARVDPSLRERLADAHMRLENAEGYLTGDRSYKDLLIGYNLLNEAMAAIQAAGMDYASDFGPD